MTHPIFQKELDALDVFLDDDLNHYDCIECRGALIEYKLKPFFLASLQRAYEQGCKNGAELARVKEQTSVDTEVPDTVKNITCK